MWAQEGQRHITAVLVGAGNRGDTYTTYAVENPELISIVAVCEPNPIRRERIAALHNIEPENAFSEWEELFAAHPDEALADAAIICTQDQYHKDPAVAFAGNGCELLPPLPNSVLL